MINLLPSSPQLSRPIKGLAEPRLCFVARRDKRRYLTTNLLRKPTDIGEHLLDLGDVFHLSARVLSGLSSRLSPPHNPLKDGQY